MQNTVKEIALPNGLIVRFNDKTRRYFGDYHQVRVEVSCEVPVAPHLFDDQTGYEAALKLLGGTACYRKLIEHQGVASSEIEATLDRVIRHFVEHSLSYFGSEAFPRRFLKSELNRIGSRSRSFVARRSHV